MSSFEPYENCIAIQKLKRRKSKNLPLYIAFLDIDSTMTSSNKDSLTNTVREDLEKNGYVVAFVTSKTEEIIISQDQRELSPNLTRPIPHLGKDKHGKRFYTDPRNTEPDGIINADIIIGSTGTTILAKQASGGYIVDEDYRKNFPDHYQQWRDAVINTISTINHDYPLCELSSIEYIENYDIGKTDIAPPDYRVEVKFRTLKNKRHFVRCFKDTVSKTDLSVQFTDDSNPDKEKYTLFITPKLATKVNAVEYIVKKIYATLSVQPDELSLLLAGDSYPDLAMGLYGGKGTQANFLLVGHSRLASYLVEDDMHEFADESLKEIKKNLVAIKSKPGGRYDFALQGSGKRTVIIGDEVFPNTKGPETIWAYLQTAHR